MHSLLKTLVVGAVLGVEGVEWNAPAAKITPAPTVDDVLNIRQAPDAITLAQILLTAVPAWLRQIAATDLPAVSSILWEEFLDDNKPAWFLELPKDIQNYLIRKFGPQSAWPTDAPGSLGSGSNSQGATATPSDTPAEPTQTQPSGSNEGASRTSISATATQSSASATSAASSARTTLETLTKSTASGSSASSSDSQLISSSLDIAQPSSISSAPEAPPVTNHSLSKEQKVGLGVGIPLGLLGAAALLLGCCILLRRRKKKTVEGSIPPGSPGFIPRFAFQERSVENLEHHTPLNMNSEASRSLVDVSGTAWDDEGVDPMENAPVQNPYAWNDHGPYGQPNAAALIGPESSYAAANNDAETGNGAMAMSDAKPIMAPALFHTHTSNRARGKRTSYTSLHSVAEVSEPDDTDSPALGRRASHTQSPGRTLIPTPPTPASAQIKRKPVASPPPIPTSPAAQAASNKLMRQTMPEHSGSSSSGLALSSSSGFNTSNSSGIGLSQAEPASPISPISKHAHSNPFHYDSYVEDYGPEYHGGYTDAEAGLYGGNTSLSQYPEPRRKGSKTDWPLRNIMGSHHRRKSSPIWDRIYEE